MKKLITFAFAAIMLSTFAAAQTTASGTLSVTATVNSSINLVFVSDSTGVALTGSGTNAATLPFGNVQAFGGTIATGVTRTPGASSFTISSPVGVAVSKANSTSANYTLTAKLNAADATNTWTVGGVTVNNTSAAQITSSGAYAAVGGSGTSYAVAVTIPYTTNSGTSISNSIAYTATAN